MADIVERLRLYAQQFEDQHAPDHITLALRAGADEIERKDAEIANLLNALADERTENMKLRAALREIVSLDDEPKCCGKGIAGYDSPPECCGDPERGIDRAQSIARAALEGK